MKPILLALSIISFFSLSCYAQSYEAKSSVTRQKNEAVKFTANITRIVKLNAKNVTLMYLTAAEYQQPVKLIVSNANLEPAEAFFVGEHIAVTGKIRLRKGYQQINVKEASQIKPVFADNILRNGGFN